MPVIALIGNKGGSGKTTVSINLACALHRRHSTLLLDADPQRSSLQWRDIAGRDDLVSVVDAVEDTAEKIDSHRHGYSYLVVDCPPSVHAESTRQALCSSDIALIPVLPSPLDLWASVHIEQVLDEVGAVNPGLRARLVVNQLEPRTRLSRLMHDALAEIPVPVARAAITRRMAYRNAVLRGISVLDAGRAAHDAAQEIQQLIDELVD